MKDNVHRLYDPTLKKAMREIELVMKKYDIGGNFTLVSPTHVENRFVPSPSWSQLINEKDEQGRIIGLRFYSKAKDFKTREDKMEADELTCHLLFQMRDTSRANFVYLEQFANIVKEKLKVEHKSFHGFMAHRDAMDEEDL